MLDNTLTVLSICRKFPEDDTLGAETCKSCTGERHFKNCILVIEFVS